MAGALTKTTTIRGLLLKFVDFLHYSSEIFNREINFISSENTIIFLSYDVYIYRYFYDKWLHGLAVAIINVIISHRLQLKFVLS